MLLIKPELMRLMINASVIIYQVEEYVSFAKSLVNKYGKKINVKFTTGIFDGREFVLSKQEKDDYEQAMELINLKTYNVDVKTNAFIAASRSKAVNDNCAYGFLTVAANGDVYPCARIPSLKPYVNIRIDSFESIVAKSDELKKKSNINNITPCKHCEIKYICGGGCRIEFFQDFANSLIYNSNNDEPSRICSKEYKDSFYDMMIRTNESIFT